MVFKALKWERDAAHYIGGRQSEFGRCAHQLKAKQVDAEKDIWERSYRV